MTDSVVNTSVALKGIHKIVELVNKKTRRANEIINEKQQLIDTSARKLIESNREVKRLQNERDNKMVGKDIDFMEQMKQMVVLDEIIDVVSTLTPEETAEYYELINKK
jgi:hypothetical protein